MEKQILRDIIAKLNSLEPNYSDIAADLAYAATCGFKSAQAQAVVIATQALLDLLDKEEADAALLTERAAKEGTK